MVPRSLEELIGSYELSSYRERVFEHAFLADLLQAAWVQGYPPLELDLPSVDAYGYDVIVSCGRIVRHVQLKATVGQISVHRFMAIKPSACILNIYPELAEGDPETLLLKYRYFGELPGMPLDVSDLKPAISTRRVLQEDGTTMKPERSNHLKVPISRFTKPLSIKELLPHLLGDSVVI